MNLNKNCLWQVASLLLLVIPGCADLAPEIVPASGVVMLRGKPLPKALVVFVPDLAIEGNYTAMGETDDEGRFELMCQGEPGACVCEHRVTILEGEYPAELLVETKQEELNAYIKNLKNRPIPKQYRSLVSTPLRVTVARDKAVYDLELQ